MKKPSTWGATFAVVSILAACGEGSSASDGAEYASLDARMTSSEDAGTGVDVGTTHGSDAGPAALPDASPTSSPDAGLPVLPDAGTIVVPDASSAVIPDAGFTTGQDAGSASYPDSSYSGGSVAISDPTAPVLLEIPGALSIEIPGGALAAPGTLSVTPGVQPPVPDWVGHPVAAYHIEVTGQPANEPLLAPAQMVFYFDPASIIAGVPLEYAAYVLWYDTDQQVLVEEPSTVDPVAGTVTVETSHFSDWWLYMFGPGDAVSTSAHFVFRFPTAINVMAWGTSDPYVVMAKVQQTVEAAYGAYVVAGFPGPAGKIPVVLETVDESLYNPLTGRIDVSSCVYSGDDSVLEFELTHEVFHAFQNAQLNMFSMGQRRWFVEAAADNAADALVLHTGLAGRDITASYPGHPIMTVDGNHEYATSYLLKWLEAKGLSLKQLQDAVFGAWIVDASDHGQQAFADLVASNLGTTFSASYVDFITWLDTDSTSPLAAMSLWTDYSMDFSAISSPMPLSLPVPARYGVTSVALAIHLDAGSHVALMVASNPGIATAIRGLSGGARASATAPAADGTVTVLDGDVALIIAGAESDSTLTGPVSFQDCDESQTGAPNYICTDASGSHYDPPHGSCLDPQTPQSCSMSCQSTNSDPNGLPRACTETCTSGSCGGAPLQCAESTDPTTGAKIATCVIQY